MAAAVRVIVYNSDEAYGPELRAALLRFDGVKIVAEVDEAVLLPQVAKQFPADVVVLHLDQEPALILNLAGQVAAESPDLAIFVVSDSTDGQLILAAMRLGVREFLTKPIDDATLNAGLNKIALRRLDGGSQGKLISLLGSAGGVGTTFLSVNLANELAMVSNARVALVDLDFRFGQVATMLDVESQYTIADLCESPEEIEAQVLERTLVPAAGGGIRVLARPTSFAQAETISAAHCVGVLGGLLNMHDYVVVDGPTRYDVGAKSVLDMADEILLVMHLLVPCVRNVARMIAGMREAGFNLDRVRLVCNRCGTASSNLSIEDVRETLGMPVYAQLPEDWQAASGSINLGETLSAHAPKSRVCAGVQELAARLHLPDQCTDEVDAVKKGGLFSKIFSDA